MPNSSRKSTPPAPSTPPKLIVPRSEAQQKLEAHIEKGRAIAQRVITSEAEMVKADADGDKWRDYAIGLLSTLFDTSSLADDYENKTQQIAIGGRSPFVEERDSFKDRINNWWIKELESILERLDLIQESPAIHQRVPTNNVTRDKDPQVDALEKIELIANRFHTIARQLRHRHADRDTLTISDEYDVQDLFHALLRLFFDDIRDEEWTPSYAGGASRIDFLLKHEQVLVEIKMTRLGLVKGKDVSNQLIIDSERYRVHPDCKMLLAFVYDPQEYLNNPSGIERDLTKTINDVPVKVIIRSR
jgi:hypothetical protein